MGPREEDNIVLLWGSVTLICGLIAFASWPFQPARAVDGQVTNQVFSQNSHTELQAPARVIVPFTPNTNPSER